MDGRLVLVTGANSGFGKVVTRSLAETGAKVVMACRSAARAEEARDDIIRTLPDAQIEVAILDLSLQSSVRRFAGEFLDQHDRIDVLVNNAAMTSAVRELTEEGIERVFATNVLGPFLLTNLLLARLCSCAPTRIINVASAFAGEFDITDLQIERRKFDNTRAYKQSKACNRLLTWELSRRLEGTGVTANAVHPGMVTTTGLYRDVPRAVRAFLRLISRFYGNKSVEQGADTITWLAHALEVEGVSGKFFSDRSPIPCELANQETEARLWSICEALVDSS